jgi:hypothetical protein
VIDAAASTDEGVLGRFVAYRRRRGGLEPPARGLALHPGFARVAVVLTDSTVEVVAARWRWRGRVRRRFDDPATLRVVHDDGEGRHWVLLGADCYWVPARWVPEARRLVRVARAGPRATVGS